MRALFLGLVLFGVLGTARAQTLRPRIAQLSPSGGQRGTTVTFTLTGTNLGDAMQLFLETPGLTVTAFKADPSPAGAKNPDGKVVATLQIAADAPLGRHALRVVTPLGVSDAGYVVVGEWTELPEKEPNNNRAQAQPLTGPVTILGRSDGNEDIDFFKIAINKGETMVFSALAGSMGSPLEPVLTLTDTTGHEVGFAAALRQPDATLTFTAPQTGEYFLTLRDLRYLGSAAHLYRLTVGRVPSITSVFPLGGRAGSKTTFSLTGANLPSPPQLSLALPAEIPLAPLTFWGLGPWRFDIGTYPERDEIEPNDTPSTATPIPTPINANGRLYNPVPIKPDIDCFKFTTTKGQVFALEVIAARLGSPLDAVLAVLDLSGKELASNDDARGRDAALTFTAPEAGSYVARVSDLNRHSGEAFVYRLQVGPVVPEVQLSFSPDCLAVAPGDRVPVTVTATRLNGFDGEIPLSFEGLPPGISLIGPTKFASGQSALSLLATAAPSATASASPLRVSGSVTLAGKPVVRRAQSLEESYTKNGEQLVRTTKPVPLAIAAITGPSDLLLSSAVDRLGLTVGKTAELKVTVVRRAGFTAKIPLIVANLPANVSVSGAEIPENKSEATLTFKAEPTAALGETILTILGRSVVDELRFSDHAAAPVVLSIGK